MSDSPATQPPARVGWTALSLAPIAIVARGAAFLVPVLIAHLYGVSAVTDAFFYALAVPSFVMVIVANAFGTVATPAFAAIHRERPADLGAAVGTSAVLSGAAAAAVGVAVLAILVPLLPVVTAFDGGQRILVARFVAELLPFKAMVGVAAVLRSACEIRGRFRRVALAPLWRGLGMIGAIVALHGGLGPHALPAGMLVGQLVEVGWLAGLLASADVRLRVRATLDPRVRQAFADVGPIFGGEVLVAANVVVDKAFAGALPAGAVTWLEYADRTRFIPQSFAESTLAPVAFATWSNQVARGDARGFTVQVDQSLRWMAAFSAGPLAGLYIGRHVIVALLFARGAFTRDDAAHAADAFGFYVPGLWSMFLGALAMRANVVQRRLWLVGALGAVSVALNALLDGVLSGRMGINGIALGSSLVWTVVPGLYVAALWPVLRPIATWRTWLPPLALAAVAAALAVGIELVHGAPADFTDPVLWIAAVVCVGLVGAAAKVTG